MNILEQQQDLSERTLIEDTKRAVRGYDLYKSGLVIPILSDNPTIQVWESNKHIVELIDDINGVYHCDCPDFEYRQFTACKHIFSVQFSRGA